MSEARTQFSLFNRATQRYGFTTFYTETYPSITGELFALTGSLPAARDIAREAYAQAWETWSVVRALDRPAMWVRATASRQVRALEAHDVDHRSAAAELVYLDRDDAILLAALRRLPMARRLPVVLHCMNDIPADLVVIWLNDQITGAGEQLDAGLDELTALLDRSDDVVFETPAESAPNSHRPHRSAPKALFECGRDLDRRISVPPVRTVLRPRTATAPRPHRLPLTAAAAAACLGLGLVYVTPAASPSAAVPSLGTPPDEIRTPADGAVDARPPAARPATVTRVPRLLGQTRPAPPAGPAAPAPRAPGDAGTVRPAEATTGPTTPTVRPAATPPGTARGAGEPARSVAGAPRTPATSSSAPSSSAPPPNAPPPSTDAPVDEEPSPVETRPPAPPIEPTTTPPTTTPPTTTPPTTTPPTSTEPVPANQPTATEAPTPDPATTVPPVDPTTGTGPAEPAGELTGTTAPPGP